MTALGRVRTWVLAAGLAGLAGGALAGPGDVLRVTAERANLRAGPSDQTQVLTQVLLGDELVELRRDGSWLGVRVTRTGEEGWIYGDLVALEAQSRLSGGTVAAGFEALPAGFDRLVGQIGQAFGYSLIADVQQVDTGTLHIVPTADFLLYGGREAHVAATLAFYQMWKSQQGDAPVTVSLLDGAGLPYVTVQDGAQGPDLVVPGPDLASR